MTPDHIDRHGSLEHYAAIKERLVMGADVSVVSVDDGICLEILKRRVEKGSAVAFSVKHKLAPGYSLMDDTLVCANRDGLAVKLGQLTGIRSLRGKHNAQNALAAVASVRECLNLAGEPTDLDWQGALSSFPGLAHRMEEVAQLGNVLYINDSKATNADSTEKALQSFPSDVYWILGGKPKDGGIRSLAPYFPGIARAYLIGEASDTFAATLEGRVPYVRMGTLDKAVAAATLDASASTARQPVVLLSPACASYDQFKNFEVRGDAFYAFVAALPGVIVRRQR